MKIIELLIDGLEDVLGFTDVALVETPAHESTWHSFNAVEVEDAIAFQMVKLAFEELTKQEFTDQQLKTYEFALEEEKQLIVGAFLIPDKLIFRVDKNHEPYYVFFSKETVGKIAEKMMKEKLLDKVNLEHDPDSLVDAYIIETWIIADRAHDKSTVYGLDLPVGTWMGMMKVDSPVHWKMIKEKKLTGYSVTGYFIDKLIQN